MSNNFSRITRTFYDDLRAADTKTEDQGVNPYYLKALQKGIIKISDDTAYISNLNINGVAGQEVRSDGMYHVFHDLNKAMHPVTGTEVFKDLKSVSQCEALPYRKFILQLECKKGLDVRDVNIRTQCLMQVCCYIYQMALKTVPGANTTSSKFWDDNGYKFPKVVLLASDISCLLIPTKHLRQYLTDVSHWVGWGSASTVHTKAENQVVYNQMKEDVVISRATTLKCGDEHYVETICDLILKLGTDTNIASDLTVTNIYRAFDYFDMYVLDSKEKEKMDSRKEIEMFIQLFFSEDDANVGKIKKHDQFENKITYKGVVYRINPDAYNVFAGLFSQKEYSRSEIKDLTAITDRLIEDADRRRRGDFYTPTVWVDEAYKLLDKNLGADWKERCVVWDCAWGTGNLTRDYRFNELYASTLEASDLSVAELYNQGGTRSNRNGTKFQYDFLNDDVEEFELAKEALAKPFERWKNTASYNAASKYFNLTQYKDMCENLYSRGALTEETKLETDKAYDKAVEILKSTKLASVGGHLLDSLLEGKELVFLINPPYAGVGSMGNKSKKKNKDGAVESSTAELMKSHKVAGTGQLYAQFIYRIQEIRNTFGLHTTLGIFSPAQLLNAVTLESIRGGGDGW